MVKSGEQLLKSVQKFVTKSTKPLEDVFNTVVKPVISQPVVKLIVSWLVIINIILSVDRLPHKIKSRLNNPVVQTCVTLLGVYVATEDFAMSLAVSLGVLVLYYVLGIFSLEGFDTIWPETDTSPKCVQVKEDDLLNLFNGDRSNLKKRMIEAGVPGNLTISDRDAPLIATYLLNSGHSKITETCKHPL